MHFPWAHLCWLWHGLSPGQNKGGWFSTGSVELVLDSLGTTWSTAEVALGKKMDRSNISLSGGWLGTLINSALQDNIALSFILSKQCRLLWPFLFLMRLGRDSEILYFFVPCALLLCFRLFLACWQFVLQVAKQNVHFKINYSKILISSFFSRESYVFLLHTSSLLLK